MSRFLERWDEHDLLALFEAAGVAATLRGKGFGGFDVTIAEAGLALPHLRYHAIKDGRRHCLLDACARRIAVAADRLPDSGVVLERPLDLLLVHWVREEDPTQAFSASRPPLPLQEHPGLGVLRRAFRVAVLMARDLGADGVVNRPKFFHDALLFQRSRLFLFLSGVEQGRFEALRRDLASLSLRDATLAVAGWCVRDEAGAVVRWDPGYLVFPLSDRLTAHFHAAGYAAAVAESQRRARFTVDLDALARVSAETVSPP
jgi:hypothetical protein